jgi:hypothetical protein
MVRNDWCGRATVVIVFGFSTIFLQAQTPSPAALSLSIPLVVPEGAPLRIVVKEKLRFKKNQPVHAQTVDPVFAFDREVIPSGTDVEGHISGFKNAPRLVRVRAMLGGNFTPIREPQLAFDSLVLKDGKTIPIQTEVSVGADTVVRFNTGSADPKKGKIATATELARQQIEAKKRAVLDTIKSPGKMDRVKEALWSFAPWHPQYLPAGSRFNAKLLSSLPFGDGTFPQSELIDLGSQPPADAVVAARLTTSLDSLTASHGMRVDAVLTRPLVSPEGHVLFPEGSHLTGNVVQAQAARRWHRNGKLAFMFTQMEPPPAALALADAPGKQEIEGRLEGVEVNGQNGAVQIDEEGGAAAASSKKRFIAPAISMVLAMNGAEGREPVRVHHIPTGAYHNNYAGHLLSGAVGFGLLGGAMGRFMGPVGSALGFYGAARSIYSNVVARGQEVTFPMNTPIEIRFGSAPPPQKNSQ